LLNKDAQLNKVVLEHMLDNATYNDRNKEHF